MNGWIIAYLCLVAAGLGISLAQHGKPREPMNFWHLLIGTAINLFLLYKGGAFA